MRERTMKKKRFHIDERYLLVNLTRTIIIYAFLTPFCVYLCIDNLVHGKNVVAMYAAFCAVMTGIALSLLCVCRFGKKKRTVLMHIAINIQCFVYWFTFAFFLYTGGTGGTSIFLFFCAAPVCMFFFNLFYGCYFCFVLFAGMAIYMNTPLRELGYQFPEMYYSRLPMMYLVEVIMCAIAQYEIDKAKIKQDDALEEARRASEAKTDFLANTSHEIRTPINAVLGMNEMILRETSRADRLSDSDARGFRESFKRIRNYSGNVDSAGSNLLAIINDILDFTKIEEGKMDIVKGAYQLSSVINDVSNMIYFKAKEKKLSFVTEVDEALPDNLYGDVVRVRQVITNVLNNAVKYTDSGSVTLKVSGLDTGREEDGKPVKELVISVSDTGIGISSEDIGKLFGKFERVNLEQNSTKEGTGLGLAITKRLLEMMDGEVKVESEYGKGSTFTLIIPQVVMSEEPIGNFKEKFEKSIGTGKSYHESFRAPLARVLIVDDTRMNLIVATEFLKDTGLAIDTAGGGKEAVKLALETPYDVILMDQRMPEMDGTEALRKIKEVKDGPNAGTPVICLTADAVVGARERYLSMGFNDYLTKPIDSTYLEAMLRKYLPAEKVEIVKYIDEEPKDVPVHDDNLHEMLKNIGVDSDQGLANCDGDESFYRTMLREYLRSSEEKKIKLTDYLKSGDMKNYGIVIHSLKSTSATIGAMKLYRMAYDLEMNAKNENTEEVRNAHDPMYSEYLRVLDAIKNSLPDDVPGSDDGFDENGVMEFLPE